MYRNNRGETFATFCERMEESDIAVGSIWHRDCDPFIGIVVERSNTNTILATCERLIERAIEEEIQSVLDSDCEEDCKADCEIHTPVLETTGAMWESVSSLNLSDEQLRELWRDGYLYTSPMA